MATAASTLISRTRRLLRDLPDLDATSASVTSGATTLTVPDTTIYYVNEYIELDQEVMRVKALTNATTLTVARAAKGSTAASHVSSSTVLIKPAFFAVEILDALNEGIQACYPKLYKEVLDSSLTSADSTYEYTIPNMPSTSTPIPYIVRIEAKEPGDLAYRQMHRFWLKRGSTPKIQFRSIPVPSSSLRIRGYGPFPTLAAISDTLDAQWPLQAEFLPARYAAASLLSSGEAGRVRMDANAVDAREQANRVGSSMAAANFHFGIFERELDRASMAPLPKTVLSVV